ncbi:hypothetical protein V5T82_15690 [Magnetovibrio sp. PR-2]|uniref:hypothetical protein n=1 Tax=Magnetovibrio sp. PR-2 TaxID=3120356 RepID=UPI002FCE3D6C
MKHTFNLIDPEAAAEVADKVTQDIHEPAAKTFFSKNVAKWLRKREDCLKESWPLPGDPAWVEQAYVHGQPLHRFHLSDDAAQSLERLHVWVCYCVGEFSKPGNLGAEAKRSVQGLPAMSVHDALTKAERWHRLELMRLNDAPKRGPNGYETQPLCSVELPNGFVWEKLPASNIAFVGYDLRNCLRNGAYAKEVALRIVALWALRHPDTGRFVAVLTTRGRSHEVLGVRGFKNGRPLAYLGQIRALLDKLECPSRSCHDLKALNL